MRLIDADALIENLRGYKTLYGVPMTKRDEQMVHYIIGHIKNLEPTAYDVEKVVEQIHDYFCKVIDKQKGDTIPLEILEYNKAICKIVRKGGWSRWQS